mgnify:FL=1
MNITPCVPLTDHIKRKCDELIIWFDINYNLKCAAQEVEQLTNEILQDKEGIEYMKKNNKWFEKVYDEHIIQKKKSFVLMNMTQSLITSILMYMWH